MGSGNNGRDCKTNDMTNNQYKRPYHNNAYDMSDTGKRTIVNRYKY